MAGWLEVDSVLTAGLVVDVVPVVTFGELSVPVAVDVVDEPEVGEVDDVFDEVEDVAPDPLEPEALELLLELELVLDYLGLQSE